MMTTSGAPASALLFPASLLSAIPVPVVACLSHPGARRPARRLSLAENLAVARDKPLRGIVTAQAHEVNAHGGLDERREVPARTDGQDEVRHGDAEYLDGARVESETLDLGRLLPALEHDVEVNLRGAADGRRAEQLADVDDAEAANLHVLAQEVGRAARELAGPRAPHLDEVVGDELVAAHDEVERALRLPHPALALDEDAEAVEVEQDAVAHLARRERFFQVLGDGADGDRADERRLDERERRALGGLQ